MEELIQNIIDLVNEQRDSQGQISQKKLEIQLRLLLEESRSRKQLYYCKC